MSESARATSQRSLLGSARALVRRVKRALKPAAPWERRVIEVDKEFDAKYGVKTGGMIHLDELTLAPGAVQRDGQRYVATDPERFEGALASLQIDCRRFTFIDLG